MNTAFNVGAIAGASAQKSASNQWHSLPSTPPPEPINPFTEKVMCAVYKLNQQGFEVLFTPEFDGSIAIHLYKAGFRIYRRISFEELKWCRSSVEDRVVYILEWLVAKCEFDRNRIEEE